MGEKKRLRRDLAAAQDRLAREAERKQDLLDEQTRILDSLAGIGFVWVGGERRQTDRLRAARAGVIVLDDVRVVREPDLAIEQDEQIDARYFSSLRTVPLRTSAYLSLTITGDPGMLGALADYLRAHR